MHIELTPTTFNYPKYQWRATLKGLAAYDDSDPESLGSTKEEALDRLWTQLLDIQKDLNELITKGKPTIQSL